MLSGTFSTSQKLATKLCTVTPGHIWPYQFFFAEKNDVLCVHVFPLGELPVDTISMYYFCQWRHSLGQLPDYSEHDLDGKNKTLIQPVFLINWKRMVKGTQLVFIGNP